MKNTIKSNRLPILFATVIVFFTVIVSGCKKFVEIDGPVTSSNSENIYLNDATAASVLTGIYIKLSRADLSGSGELTSVTAIAGLSADEFLLTEDDPSLLPYYSNSLLSTTFTTWSQVYSVIFVANSAIEGLNNANSLTPSLKQQLLGEAKFVRAFCYFYLVNLYGEVPLALSSDYKINSTLPKVSIQTLYDQIVLDLKEAKILLPSNYVNSVGVATPERTRPNSGAATALLSRVYLYTKDYNNAEKEASILLNNKTQYDLVSLPNTFLKNNAEAIWQLQPVGTGTNTNTKEGQFFIPRDGSTAPVYLTEDLLNKFEPEDQRREKWIYATTDIIPFYYPFKYRIGSDDAGSMEYSMVIRLAELYLIRAEARTHLGQLRLALDDLNVIRKRAGLPPLDLPTSNAILDAIIKERCVELFAEWGHRWLDLKRLNLADIVLKPLKNENWQSTDQLYPIPQSDIDQNPNLRGQQNAGY